MGIGTSTAKLAASHRSAGVRSAGKSTSPVARLPIAHLAVLGLSGCTLATDTSPYVFVDSPCPRPAQPCTGGRTLWFVSATGDIARQTGNVIPGFNLDGTSDPVCGHADVVSPTGTPGIDNALAPLLAGVEGSQPKTWDQIELDGILEGRSLQIVEVEHVDDLGSDDCIGVQLRHAFVPPGEDVATYLDANMDRVLDSDLVLDYGSSSARDDRACIIDGVLHADMGDAPTSIPSSTNPVEVTTTALNVRAEISETALTNGWEGGGLSLADIVRVLDLADDSPLVSVLESAADLYPGPDGRCSHLSIALVFDSIPFVPGAYR